MANFFKTTILENKQIILFLLILAIAQLISIYFELIQLINLTSVFLNLSMAFFIYQKISKLQNLSLHWYLAFSYVFLWAICDTFWFVFISKENEALLEMLYAIPTILMLAAVASLYYKCFISTRSKQMLLDIIFTGIMIAIFIGYITLNDKFFADNNFVKEWMFLLADILLVSLSASIFSSIANLRDNTQVMILLIGLNLFAIHDIFFTISTLNGINLTYSYSKIIFEITFFLTTLAIFFVTENDKNFKFIVSKKQLLSNFIERIAFLLIIPTIAIIYIQNINISVVAISLFTMFVYGVISHKISNDIYLENEKRKEKELKNRLERSKNSKKHSLNETNKILTELSRFDKLTKALNRKYFLEQLYEMIMTKSLNECVSLYTIDINHFKIINDTYGHIIGDKALALMVMNLKSILPKDSIIGRFGGDDMLIAVRENIKQVDHNEFAQKILRKVTAPLQIDDKRIFLTINIGISFTETSQIKIGDLMSQSSMALQVAKDNISIPYFRYNNELGNLNAQRHYIKILIDRVDFDKEFSLDFQPQFNIKTNKIVGIEAFIRWHSEQKGYIAPLDFIPVAQQSPIINHIGRWVLNEAILKIKNINETYKTDLNISINVSPKELENADFAKNIIQILEIHNAKPSWLNLELDQSLSQTSLKNIKPMLLELKDRGVNIFLDNFGTGFASLDSLNKIHLDKIKIAKKLISNIQNDKVDRSVAMAVITLAKSMDIKIIAQCVENKEQLQILENLGCDEIQGNVLCKPLNEKKFDEFLSCYLA